MTSMFFLLVGAAVLITGGEILVRGAVRFASLFKIPPLIIGLTIVAICTSAPEMAVSLVGILGKSASADIAVGNVVGSNIYNMLFILGLTALYRPLGISSVLVKREIPFLIVVSLATWLLAWITTRATEGGLLHAFPQWGGFLFIAAFIGYMIWTIRAVRKNSNDAMAQDLADQQVTVPVQTSLVKGTIISLVLIAVGLALLIWGSNMFVDGAVGVATLMGVSELVISLTVLAAGTSLPELVVSLIAAIQGKQDIAIGNIIGSNTFNLLGILGLSSALVPGGLTLSRQAFVLDIPIMIAVAIVGGVLCITGRKLSRWEGAVLLLGYAFYVYYLFRFC
ncbi:MAG: calcium/sodium antiporter [Planctomycetia bacterium]|nr:calcium/sodium antiporter [Planctomycetia bacterium]